MTIAWHNCEVYQCSANVRPYHIAITETARANLELAEAEEMAAAEREQSIDPAHVGTDPAIE